MKNLSKITILAAGLIVAISAFASENLEVAIKFRATNTYICYDNQNDSSYATSSFSPDLCTWTLQEDQSNGLETGFYNIFAKNTVGIYADNSKALIWDEKSNNPVHVLERHDINLHEFTWFIQKPHLLGAPYYILKAPFHHVLLDLLVPENNGSYATVYTQTFNKLSETGRLKYAQIDIIKLKS